LIVHGLGEHTGRYEALALQLNAWGFDAIGYDHYGHGQSDGPRGGLLHPTQLLDDLATVIDHVRADASLGVNPSRLILLGHSMGGLVASLFVAHNIRPVTALIVSSPAWDAGLNPLQRLLVAILPGILPNLTVGNGLDPHWISHDPHQVAAYRNDPLVHDRISARLAQFIAETGRTVFTKAKTWTLPTLLLYAGQDKLVHPRGSQQFEALAPVDKVDSHCFANLYHELFNEAEPGRSKVMDALRKWLEAGFGG
jgi:alpha-beta hydrolase superfamily lysophospholipase